MQYRATRNWPDLYNGAMPQRPDAHFFSPRVPVGVVSLQDTGEALMMRAILEHLGAAVDLYQVGTPADFLLVLGQVAPPPYLLICAHGTEAGWEFGEYGDGVDTSLLTGTALPASALAGRVRLSGCTVISTACLSGSPEMAAAMLSGGAAAYLAPDDYPDGADTGLLLMALFHGLLQRGLTLEAAYGRTVAVDSELSMFKLHFPPLR